VSFSREADAELAAHGWPGNVRELENLLERLSVVCAGAPVGRELLPFASSPGATRAFAAADGAAAAADPAAAPRMALPVAGLNLRDTLAAVESDLIAQALGRADGVVAHAARLLGIGRTTLLEKLRKHPARGEDAAAPDDDAG